MRFFFGIFAKFQSVILVISVFLLPLLSANALVSSSRNNSRSQTGTNLTGVGGAMLKCIGFDQRSLISSAIGTARSALGGLSRFGSSGSGGSSGSEISLVEPEGGATTPVSSENPTAAGTETINEQNVGLDTSAFEGLSGNELSQSISGSLGTITGSTGISGVLSSAASGAISAASSVVNSLGLSGVSSLLSSGLGSIPGVGAVLGMLGGGGGPVPTDPTTIKEDISKMRQKQTCLDAMTYTAAKNALAMMQAEVANFINTGYINPFTGERGGSFFPKNLGTEYGNIAKNQTNILLGQIKSSNNPLASQIMPDVIRANQNPSSNSFNQKTKYTLDQVAGGKDKALRFTAGDKTACASYLRCLNSLAEPQNNPWGLYSITMDELAQKKAEEVENAKTEYLAGQGTFPEKQCVDYEVDPDTGDVTCTQTEVSTPAIAISAQLQELVTSPQRRLAEVNSAGELEGLDDFFLSGIVGSLLDTQSGFSGISERGGAAERRFSTANVRDRDSLNQVVATARDSAESEIQILRGNIPLIEEVGYNVGSTSECYARRDQIWEGPSGNRPSTTNPLAGDVAVLNSGEYGSTSKDHQNRIVELENLVNQLDDISSRASQSSDISNLLMEFQEIVDQIPTPTELEQYAAEFQALQSRVVSTKGVLNTCLSAKQTERAAKNASSSNTGL